MPRPFSLCTVQIADVTTCHSSSTMDSLKEPRWWDSWNSAHRAEHSAYTDELFGRALLKLTAGRYPVPNSWKSVVALVFSPNACGIGAEVISGSISHQQWSHALRNVFPMPPS